MIEVLKRAKDKLFNMRLDAIKRAESDCLLSDKLGYLGEAVAYEKAVERLCRAIERDKSIDDVAHTLDLLGKRYVMLCGGMEGAGEHDSCYYGGQVDGFYKAHAVLLFYKARAGLLALEAEK